MSFSTSETPAFLWILLWLSCLVCLGLGVRSLVDRGMLAADHKISLTGQTGANDSEIDELRDSIRLIRSQLSERELVERTRRGDYNTLITLNGKRCNDSLALISKVKDLRSGNEKLAIALADYKASYRKKLWNDAAGQSLGRLKTRSGDEYRNAVIKRVTAAGLEIEHQGGLARIPYVELPDGYETRFQWLEEASYRQ